MVSISGGNDNDILTGSDSDDELSGGSGNDNLFAIQEMISFMEEME